MVKACPDEWYWSEIGMTHAPDKKREVIKIGSKAAKAHRWGENTTNNQATHDKRNWISHHLNVCLQMQSFHS